MVPDGTVAIGNGGRYGFLQGVPARLITLLSLKLTMRLFRLFLAAVLLAFSLATQAGASDGGTMASLTGQVMYRERIALRPGSIVTVKLVDVSRADVKATVLAEQRIENPVSIPVPFKLDYDSDAIDARMSYAVQAYIHDAAGRLLWASTEHIGVLTRGNPADNIEVWVYRIGSHMDSFRKPVIQLAAAGKTLVLDCEGLEVVVRTGPDEITLYLPGRDVVLPQVQAASGVKYEGQGLLLWMKGDDALFEVDGVRYTGCVLDVVNIKLQSVSWRRK